MSYRRSRANAQHVRELHRRRDALRRAVDARIAELTATREGAR